MEPYRVIEPANYKEMHDLGHRVSQTILARKIPQPDHIAKILGDGAVGAYYLMHALLYSIEYGRRRGVLEPARRDRKAIQRHSFDGAFKPYFRLKYRRLPSNYLLTLRENKGVLVHDLGEEFGQTLLGALVVNDVIRYLLGEETGKDADLLTNKNALLLDSLDEELKQLPQIDHNGVYRLLKEKRAHVVVEEDRVLEEYQRVLGALKVFESYVREKVDYIPKSSKDNLIGIITDLSSDLLKQISSGDLLVSEDATKSINVDYDNVIGIMERGAYIPVEKKLLLPDDPEFLLTLKKTLYVDQIRRINGKVKSDIASQNGKPADDSYLAPIMEKLAESTDTVANMDLTLYNATSIFRKARIVIASGIELVEHLKRIGVDYQRLQPSVNYLFRNLYAVVNGHLAYLEERAEGETTWKDQDLKAFQVMEEKMMDLEERVTAMEGPGWVRGAIMDIGSFLGVTYHRLAHGVHLW